MAGASTSGLASQSASSREPMAVAVLSKHRQQRALAAALADGAGNLQAAAARLVDLQRARGAVGDQPVDVLQRGLLRFGQVIQHGAGGRDRLVVGRTVAEAEALQARRAKVLGQRLPGRRRAKRPSPDAA